MTPAPPTEPIENSAGKAALRSELRARRRELSGDAAITAARRMAEHLAATPRWRNLHSLALYLPNDGEIDSLPLVERAWAAGKAVYLPRIRASGLDFALWERGVELVANRFGIGEPATAAVPPAELDLVALPLVGFDGAGNRLGMGAGYYDRALKDRALKDRALTDGARPLLLGLAYQCQQVTDLPADPWDVGLDAVVTEEGFLRCGPRW